MAIYHVADLFAKMLKFVIILLIFYKYIRKGRRNIIWYRVVSLL
jgi:hypothetical protein